MVMRVRRQMSALFNKLRTGGNRAFDAALKEINRPPPPKQKAQEERVKHITAILNILAGTCFGVGVVTPIAQHKPVDLGTWAFGAIAVGLTLAARRVLRYIPEPVVTKDPTNG